MPREYVPAFVHSWSFQAQDDSTGELQDGHGLARARVLLTSRDTRSRPDGLPVPRPRRRVPVTLPDGSTATMRNGVRRFGSRRARTRGLVELAGRQYVFSHRSSRRARVYRDGTWLATSRRGGMGTAPWPEIVAHEDLDPFDEVAVALFCRVLRPGRPRATGFFWEVLDVLTSG